MRGRLVLALLLAATPAGAAPAAWQAGRDLVKRGERRESKAERISDFLEAERLLDSVLKSSPSDAEAHFWRGVAMGRRGETQGILKSLFLVKPIRREMTETLRLEPDHAGAHRVLGEILWQVPGFAGGDKRKALEEFESAVRLEPSRGANYIPLAKAYAHFGRKDAAVELLKRLENLQNPADPEEHAENLSEARRLMTAFSR